MPTDDGVESLKLYWDYFFKAETGSYEKTCWLDLFLSEFLLQLKHSKQPKELITFCPISGIVTLVGCELLCGIHRVTSSINTHYAVGSNQTLALEDEKTTPFASARSSISSADVLQKYILSGITWRCLVLLRALGVEGLSCCRQLSSVLIWLFGELSSDGKKLSNVHNPHVPTDLEREPIHLLFSNKIWSKHKFHSGQSKKTSTPAKVSNTRLKQRTISKNGESNPRKKEKKDVLLSSESNYSNDDLEEMNRSLSVKVVNASDDFEYYNSAIRSGEEYHDDAIYKDPFEGTKKKKAKAEDYLTDNHKEIINSFISPFELTLIITDLLRELCKTESSLSGSEGSQISMQCISFSLKNLCALQFGSSPVSSVQYNSQEVCTIKVALTELLIVSLDKVLLRSDLCAKLINNGILPMLLRILEDVLFKFKTKLSSKDENILKDKNECDEILKFIFGVAYSILAFFYSLLMQCRSVDKLKEFTEQFKLYSDCHKGGLMKECIELMMRLPADKEDVIVLTKKLVESIGKLICGMKRVRSEVVHSAACPRNKHKICRERVLAGMHHHHDVLGEANIGLAQLAPCCVAILYNTLSSLLIDEEVSAEQVLRTKILYVMLNSGVCCCLSPGKLMENIVRLMLTHHGVATLCLTVLEHTVYGDLGASILYPKVTDQLPCAICEQNVVPQNKPDQKHCAHSISSVHKKHVSSFLIHYNSLLQMDNHNTVLHSTVSHLLRVTPKCRVEMKYELLFSVMYPTFIVAKHRYIIRQEDAAYFLTVSCLNIFTSLLNTVAFAEQFIQKGGLSYVLELVALPEFSKQCCSILEIAIIVEICKLIRDHSGDTSGYYEIAALSSVQMLLKSLHDMKEKFLKIYKLKLPEDKFEELCDLSEECQLLGCKKASKPQDIIRSDSSPEDSMVEECVTMEDYLELTKNIWTFWKCCAGLCLYSPMFRRYLVTESVFLDSYRMLKVILYYLGNNTSNVNEMRMLIKILESLLTIQFAVSDGTGQIYKEISTRLVRASLLAGVTMTSEGGGIRSACEMLIRVATARPSDVHVMPPYYKAKLPPLQCPSVSSEWGGSSGDDSIPAACASEHSDPFCCSDDEGYEADVEIGTFDLMSSNRSRKSSTSTIIADDTFGYACDLDPYTLDCNEYAKTGSVTHPELCVIVIDILTQLIQKLLEKKGEEYVSLSEVGVSLARACCARLSTALSTPSTDPRAAVPLHLIQRLTTGAAANLLTQRSQQLEELQRSILDLVHVLASQSIDSTELGSFLKLFTSSCPPLDILLGSLSRMLDNVQPNMPDCILCFPVERFNNDLVDTTGDMLNALTLNTATSQSQVADTQARMLYQQHLNGGISSCWSRAALRCGVEGFSVWLQGFSAVLWLRLPSSQSYAHNAPSVRDSSEDEDSKPECSRKQSPTQRDSSSTDQEIVHVFSIGHESLMFEFWTDINSGALHLKLSRPDPTSRKILSDITIDCGIPLHQWNCLGFNVKEIVYKRKIHIQITLFVNGRECETASLPLPGILVRKIMPMTVLIGDTITGNRTDKSWLLSSIAVLRAPLLNPYTALYVTARGPNATLLTMCQILPQLPNYPLLLTSDILDCNIDWDQVFEVSNSQIRELQDNLFLNYSAQSPTIINLYHQTVSSPTVFTNRVTPTSLIGSSGHSTSHTNVGSSIPETLFVAWNGTLLPSQYKGISPAVSLLGGSDVFLYLFARVVELNASPQEQALALSILLKTCRIDNRIYSQFTNNDSLELLRTVLATDKCRMSHHLLKVFLDEACSVPVLANVCGKMFVMTKSDGIIVEPDYVVFLIRAWKEFEKVDKEQEIEPEVQYPPTQTMFERTERSNLETTLFVSLHILLRDDHPHRMFNQYQLNRVNLLEHILLACKDRFLNSSERTLPLNVSNGIVELVRGLLSTPPSLPHVGLLMDFLLLMHQASDTFVTHSRANFYFLLTSETQTASEFNFLNFMTKRKSRKSKKKATSSVLPEAGYVMVEIKSKSNINEESQTETKQKGTEDSDIHEGESSIDSTKDLKSLFKLHSKDKSLDSDGKYRSSLSTSEASDVTLEESGTHDTSNDQQNESNEYVVIDCDEMEKSQTDASPPKMQQSDIMMTGDKTSSWEVVEGLLLLLHDVLCFMPDNVMLQAMGTVLQPEVVVVLSSHRSPAVRAAAVRLLSVFPNLPDILFVHTAHQVTLYPTSWDLVTSCAMLVSYCDASLEDQLDDNVWLSVSEKWLTRCPPLLALLPCCLQDVPLAHNITILLRKVIQKANVKTLTDMAVTEVLIRSLRVIGTMPDPNFEGRDLILEELRALLGLIAVKGLKSHSHMQAVTDMHYLLNYLEISSSASRTMFDIVRDSQCCVFFYELDYLEDKLHSYGTATNYFTTVLSTAVSLTADNTSGGSLPRSELANRHRTIIAKAVQFVTTRDPQLEISNVEVPLVERLFSTLINAAHGSHQRPKWWVSTGADWVGPFSELFLWLVSPLTNNERLKAEAIRQVYHAPPNVQQLLTPSDPAGQKKLSVYLLCMLKTVHAHPIPVLELSITDWVRSWAVSTQEDLLERESGVSARARHLAAADHAKRTSGSQRQAIAKVVFSKEALANKVTESAMSITRLVVDMQNAQRKSFMDYLRRSQSDAVIRTQKWQKLIENYTHEQALWYDEKSYPKSWELDPTEGPGRVRVRLRRCHLNIDNRFFKEEFQKPEPPGPAPLSYLFTVGGARCDVVARLQYMSRVTHVTVTADTPGDLLLSDRYIHLIPDSSPIETKPGCYVGSTALCWPLSLITEAVTRRWCLREVAVELITSTGRTHFIAFNDMADRNAFLKALNGLHIVQRSEQEALNEATNQWRNGLITNWEYIMKLNDVGGRSYNDLMQYPVVPFVLADYTSRILDLNDPNTFRDLSKPMAVQDKARETHYINTYNDLRQARREGSSPLLSRQPHHYASLYSNSGAVLHYLLRLPPYTKLFLSYQDNNFDMPDRTFHSLQTTWRLITRDSPTDVKELIPEFFYLPEFLENNEGLNLGVRQCGVPVDDVELPAWAPDARTFVLIHRQAMEAAVVTDTLPHWIDLVFGYKQTGQPAIDAINVFPACTYYGFEPSSLPDEVSRQAAAAMVRTYGQTPRVLLRQPHPHTNLTLLHQHSAPDQPEIWAGLVGGRWGSYCGSPACGPVTATLVRQCGNVTRLFAALTPRVFMPEIWAGLVGGRWGSYCGSPACGPVTATLVRQCGNVTRLVAAPTPRVVMVASSTAAPVPLPEYWKGVSSSVCVVSWGHADGGVRVKRRRDLPPELLFLVDARDEITVVSTTVSPHCPIVFGFRSGAVLPLSVGSGRWRGHAMLRAHTSPLTDIHACAAFRLLVTADRNGKAVISDLDTLTYIRTIPNRDSLPISCVTISPTLCDIATVHPLTNNDQYRCTVRVHTVAGRQVGAVRVSEVVESVCYSRAPEGTSVNSLALGLRSGGVKLYSSWDLRAVTYIPPMHAGVGLVSITYSWDSQVLFAGRSDGSVVVFESQHSNNTNNHVKVIAPQHVF